MERTSTKRKILGRKYKRYAAAAIGAAIMTGAALPGIPVITKAFAAETPASPPIVHEQTTMPSKGGWHEHKYDWPGPKDNKGWVENGKIYYSSDKSHDHHRHGYFHYFSSPIDFLKETAGKFGFDSYRDSFTMIHQSRHKATVQVINNDTGQRFKIDLERHGGDWHVTVVRGIGDANFPATYRSYSRF